MSGFDDLLGTIATRMASEREVAAVLAAITRGLAGELDAALARIWLADKGGVALDLAASAGLSERLDGSHAHVAIDAGKKIGQIALARAPLYIADVGEARVVDQAWVRANAIASFAGYPLVYRGELLGVLALFARRALADDERARLGAFAAQAAIAIANARLFEQVARLSRRLEAENAYLKAALHGERAIVGASTSLAAALHEVAQVAPTTTTVLLVGETGTGKELFARAVYAGSPRVARALVAVNCAAIAPTLVESELFGHEQGAFTGATARRIGRFELAHRGTLFLDEIGELPLEAQPKLLRALQEQRFARVGGVDEIAVDVRVIAATNKDLAAMVKAGTFRADLFYRLSVFPIRIPPLRDRRDDLPALVATLARRFGVAAIEPDALAYLQAYDWPGNVRELQNVIERAAILARGRAIGVQDLPELRADAVGPAGDGSLKERVDAFERAQLVDAMARAGGNQSEAARLLHTSRATLQYKLKLFKL